MPSPAAVHVDAALSDFATAYKNNGFIADKVCPIKSVTKRSDKYFTRNRKDVSTIVNDRLSPNGEANEADYDVGTDNYSVEDRGLVGYVSNTTERNADAPISPEQWKVNSLMQRLMLAREKRVADLLLTQSNFLSGNYTTVSNYWSDKVAGSPLEDINTGIAAIPDAGEGSRLYLVMARPVWNALRLHPDMLGLRGGGTSDRGQVALAEAAEYLGVDELFVSNVMLNTANTGQTASLSRVWTATKAVIVRVPPSDAFVGDEIEAFAATFRVEPGIETRTWDEPKRGKGGSVAHQVEFSDDEKILQNDQAYLLQGLLA